VGGSDLRLDLRVALPIVTLGVVVLAIIFVELCGREDVEPRAQGGVTGPTATLGPTFTPGPSPTLSPLEPTPTAAFVEGGRDRDIVRLADLQSNRDALAVYFDEHGEYPNTEGSIQTLCAFPDIDIGCALEEVLSPLPQDPLGDVTTNGYWYASNGETYTVFAIRESDAFPECLDHPPFLEQFDSVYCLSGP
jgi:hypothetical protein